MSRGLKLAAAACVVWLGLAAEARACGCVMSYGMYQPCGAYWSADVVFKGTVAEVGPLTPVPGSDGKVFTGAGQVTRFRVDEAFRGVAGDVVETSSEGTSCDYHFKPGEQYFVYGSRSARDGKIYVSSCSATKTQERATADLAFARGAVRGEPTPSLIGLVTREVREAASSYRSQRPLDGIEITIESGGKSAARARTDAEGAFRVFGLSPGVYAVRARTPRELRHLKVYGPETAQVRVLEGRCSAAAFVVTSLSTVSGRVVDATGAPTKTKVNLVPLDESGAEVRPAEGTTEVYTDEGGRYLFEWVAPGRYRVAVNPHSQPGRSDPPYRRVYLPGVFDPARSAVINVSDGGQHEAEDFRLPAPLTTGTVEGVVVTPDGKPVPHALLTLEFTEREWIETERADEHGRFRLKLLEGYKYLVAAEVRSEVGGKWTGRHSEPAEVMAGEAGEPVRLVITRPGFYAPLYVQRKRKEQK
ncbi:MAG TPA: hypothetical protein VF240_13190 [Pyrinomonadaceae bacterium]